jgi:ankyrin repeat protein
MRFRVLLSAAVLAAVGAASAFGQVSQATLIDAVQTGNRAAAVKLIDQRVDVKTPASDGTTALHWAAHNGDADLVDRLIKAGATVNAKNEFGSTPLVEAALSNSTAVIDTLLKAGADANAAYVDGETVLMIVARSTNVKAAKLLLDHGANVNAAEAQKQQTALMWATAQSQGPMVRELIAHGADVNARSYINPTATANYSDSTFKDWPSNVSAEPRAGPRAAGGLTPLLYAAREGCLECSKALIEAKANLNMADPEGITPLIMSITNFHFDVAAALIKGGANPDRWDLWGRGPLYCAVDMNTIPHGGRTDLPSTDDTTSLQIIEMLLDAGANPNLQLKLLPPYRNVGADRGVDGLLTIGVTPLVRAAKGLDAPAIRLLVAHGANLTLTGARGITPIMAAAGMGSVDADTRGFFTSEDTAQRSRDSIEALVKAGADVNSTAPNGQTPLHAAAFWGWNLAVQYLVDHGAKVDVRDKQGKTVVDSALGKNGGNSRGGARIDVHQDTADLLVKLGAPPSAPAGAPPLPAAPVNR